MRKIYTIGRYDIYSDGEYKLTEIFTTDSPYWRVVDGKVFYVHWYVRRGKYIERGLTSMKMSKEEAISGNCGCYYEIID